MNLKSILLPALSLISLNVFAQNQNTYNSNNRDCYTDSIGINTGYDYVEEIKLSQNITDPQWRISSQSSTVPGVIGNVTTSPSIATGYWYESENANWIGKEYVADNPNAEYKIVFSRKFTLCQKDSVIVSFGFANDNYCTSITLDNITFGSPIVPQAADILPIYCGSLFDITDTFYLDEGEHELKFEINNYPKVNYNPHALYVEGGISSYNGLNSLLNNSVNPTCECTPTGLIDHSNLEHYINVFPNPAQDEINIHTQLNNKDMVQLNITDIYGRIIDHYSFASNKSLTIYLNNYSSGVYFFHFATEKGNAVKKIIVSK